MAEATLPTYILKRHCLSRYIEVHARPSVLSVSDRPEKFPFRKFLCGREATQPSLKGSGVCQRRSLCHKPLGHMSEPEFAGGKLGPKIALRFFGRRSRSATCPISDYVANSGPISLKANSGPIGPIEPEAQSGGLPHRGLCPRTKVAQPQNDMGPLRFEHKGKTPTVSCPYQDHKGTFRFPYQPNFIII